MQLWVAHVHVPLCMRNCACAYADVDWTSPRVLRPVGRVGRDGKAHVREMQQNAEMRNRFVMNMEHGSNAHPMPMRL